MTVRIRLVISVIALALGLVVTQAPAPKAMADLAPCGNCGAVAQVDG